MDHFHRRNLWSKITNTFIVLATLQIKLILGEANVRVTRYKEGDMIQLLDNSLTCGMFDAIKSQNLPEGYCYCRTSDMVPKAGTFMEKCIYDLPSITRAYFLF